MKTVREQITRDQLLKIYDQTAAAFDKSQKALEAVTGELLTMTEERDKAKESLANYTGYVEDLEAETLNLKQLLLPYIKNDLEMEGRL